MESNPLQPDPQSDRVALRDLLLALIRAQTDLHDVLRSKLHAMRRADIGGMQAAAADEAALLEECGRIDLQRHALITRLAARDAVRPGRLVRMSDLLPFITEPLRGELVTLTRTLRERMLAVAEANRVVMLVSREMHDHFRTLFSSMIQAVSEPAGYRADGRIETREACVLDAVG